MERERKRRGWRGGVGSNPKTERQRYAGNGTSLAVGGHPRRHTGFPNFFHKVFCFPILQQVPAGGCSAALNPDRYMCRCLQNEFPKVALIARCGRAAG